MFDNQWSDALPAANSRAPADRWERKRGLIPGGTLPGWQTHTGTMGAEWDGMVRDLPGCTIFHESLWAGLLAEFPRQRPVYVTWPGPLGTAVAWPLMEIRGRFSGSHGVALPLTDVCSPLASEPDPDYGSCIRGVLELARERRWRSVELRLPEGLLKGPAPSLSFFTHRLPLGRKESELLQLFAPGVRRAIRKASDRHLRVEFRTGPDGVHKFYRLYCSTRRRHGLPPQPLSFFEALAAKLLDGKSGYVVVARQGSTPVAAAVILISGKAAHYKYAASDYRQQSSRGNNLVLWETIRKLTADGMDSLDFGRTSLANSGLRRFKQGWGTVESRLHYYRFDPQSGKTTAQSDMAHGWHTRLFRLLPNPLLRFVGAIAYGHHPDRTRPQ